MSFDLASMLNALHQAILERFEPLFEQVRTIPALQFLEPYRDALPYLLLGLGFVLLFVLLRALRGGSGRRKHKKTSSPSPQAGYKRPSVQGRALDDMSFFEHLPPTIPSTPPSEPAPFAVPPSPSPAEPNPAEVARVMPQPAPVILSAPPPLKAEPLASAGEPLVLPSPAASFQGPETARKPVPPAAAPVPPRPSSSFMPPQNEAFQNIYIKMYIDQQLTTNFSALRANVNSRLAGSAPTEPLMPTGSGNTEDAIYAHLALASLDALRADEARLGSGELSPHGQELCKIYDYALNCLRTTGKVSEESAKALLRQALEQGAVQGGKTLG